MSRQAAPPHSHKRRNATTYGAPVRQSGELLTSNGNALATDGELRNLEILSQKGSRFCRLTTWNSEDVVTRTDTRLYGTATAQPWNRLHPRLTRRAAWTDHDGPLPVIEGTVIRLTVERLPSGGVNKPVWLWCAGTDADSTEVDRCQA